MLVSELVHVGSCDYFQTGTGAVTISVLLVQGFLFVFVQNKKKIFLCDCWSIVIF